MHPHNRDDDHSLRPGPCRAGGFCTDLPRHHHAARSLNLTCCTAATQIRAENGISFGSFPLVNLNVRIVCQAGMSLSFGRRPDSLCHTVIAADITYCSYGSWPQVSSRSQGRGLKGRLQQYRALQGLFTVRSGHLHRPLQPGCLPHGVTGAPMHQMVRKRSFLMHES